MSFVNTKQQRLIDETTSNYVKYEDKLSSQYLKLRQDIFQLHVSISKEVTSEAKYKVQLYRFELDKMVLQYTNHLNELIQLLEISKSFSSPYEDQLAIQFEALTTRFTTLQDSITNIKQVQKPLLDKMTVLVKKFHNPVQEVQAGIVYDKESTDLDTNTLVFSSKEIKDLFKDFDFGVDVTNILQNTRLFQKLDDEKYRFKLTKSLVNDKIEDFDKLIGTTVESIQQQIVEGGEIKERWNGNAKKLELIRSILESQVRA